MRITRVRGHLIVLLLSLVWVAIGRAGESVDFEVHEWGTFTSLQDESGNAIAGINSDDEPVPKFVHRLAPLLLLTPTEVPPIFFQGAPRCHPDVTMRLETPVLYFHPPASQSKIFSVNVKVGFRGGWLTEFYPNAEAVAPGVTRDGSRFGRLNSETTGTLAWNDLQVGGAWKGPETKEHVWLAPRNVKAAAVQTADGEREQYLFYRGVAHLEAPLRVSREGENEFVLRSQLPGELRAKAPLKVPYVCLVDIRTNGTAAFRMLAPFELTASKQVLARTPAHFEKKDYNANNLQKMKSSLRSALIADGLFADEADALLNTWELSYFKSAGLRFFFIVPPAWTDHVLPLEVSPPARVDRVMVGRIELVTPEQRRLLGQLAQLSPQQIEKDATDLRERYYNHAIRTGGNIGGSPGAVQMNQVMSGEKSLAQYAVAVPQSYRAYLDLGRFRNALLLDAEKRRATDGLQAFIKQYSLKFYTTQP